MESPTSSTFSLTSAPSMISDIDHSPNCAGEKGTDLSPHDPANCTPSILREASVVPEHDGKPIFDAGDGDIRLEIGGTRFEVHKYLLKRFNLLKAKVYELSSDEPLLVQGDRGIAGDFRNTFKVLYATVLEGPFEFDNPTLVSALRIATTYDYPALRTYTIARLEQARLTAVERIEIAREFGLASWEEPAYIELCERDEPITGEEANILGMEMFVRVAEIREREQRRRGKELDAGQKETSAVENPDSAAIGPLGGASVTQNSVGGDVCTFEAKSSGAGHSDSTCNSPKVEGTMGRHEEEPTFTPSFVDIQTSCYELERLITATNTYKVGIPGCECLVRVRGGKPLPWSPKCALSPCAVSAFKGLQVQQLSQANRIAELKSSMSKLNASATPAPPPDGVSVRPKHPSVHEAVHRMIIAMQE